jgi:hypothetical protein
VTGCPGRRAELVVGWYVGDLPQAHDREQCWNSVGKTRTATVNLAQPLGERVVLEVRQGLPVPVTITA